MIYDRMEEFLKYASLLPGAEQMLAAVRQLSKWETGRFTCGDGFILLQEGETKTQQERRFERHKKYIDVHILVEGKEEVAWESLENLAKDTPFVPEKDIEFLTGKVDHVFALKPGMFCVFFPDEPHVTQMHTEEPGSYRKIVFKLPAR